MGNHIGFRPETNSYLILKTVVWTCKRNGVMSDNQPQDCVCTPCIGPRSFLAKMVPMKIQTFYFLCFLLFCSPLRRLGGNQFAAMYFFSHLNPSIRMMLRNFGIRIPPRQVTLYQTVCIWLLHFFLLGGNSIASKSPRTNSNLPSSRQLEENTEDKTEAGVKSPQSLYFTL